MGSPTELRLVREDDVPAIATLYRDVYGDDYPFREFYDTTWIKRGVFDDSLRWYVAVEPGGRLLGSAAVMLNAGDADDGVSELGRLVVHPDARGQRLGGRLVDAIVDEAFEHTDFAFAECRTAHVGSQLLFQRADFAMVGIEPLAYELDGFETMILAVRLNKGARALRRGSPRVISTAYELATRSLSGCEIDHDVVVAAGEGSYPTARLDDGYRLTPMTSEDRYQLLRLGRLQFLEPEVFGKVRLEHGHLRLRSHQAEHLVLWHGTALVGGLGFTWDDQERKLQIYEAVGANPVAKGTLMEAAIGQLEQRLNPRYLSIDVAAHAPTMQATLERLGFVPVAYLPSMAYCLGERFDVIRMVKLRQQPELGHWVRLDEVIDITSLVEKTLHSAARGTTVDAVIGAARAFEGLSDGELRDTAALCRERVVEAGAPVFADGSTDHSLYVILDGSVAIERNGKHLATLGRGETVGEMGLLEDKPRSAGARAVEKARLLTLTPQDFERLLEVSPRAGTRILRNLARMLSARLRHSTSGDGDPGLFSLPPEGA